MGFPGTWMTESESVVYRVVPKCACSTIGQIMFYSDHGRFFDGVYPRRRRRDAQMVDGGEPAAHRTQRQGPQVLCLHLRAQSLCAHPVLVLRQDRGHPSATANAIAATSCRNVAQKYGIDVGSPENGFEFDQIASFRRFLLFARDTIRWRRPMEPDIHWSAMSGHVSTFIVNGGRYNRIFFTERFNEGMQQVLDGIETPVKVDLKAIPRFNESEGHGPARAHEVSAYFDDLSRHLVWEIYKKDFQLFRYDFDNPDNKFPIAEIDLDEVHARLGD